MLQNWGKVNGYRKLEPEEFRRIMPHPLIEQLKSAKTRSLALNTIGAMEANGFALLNDRGSQHYREHRKSLDYLLDGDELLFKRKEGSNFSVFVKIKKDKLLVHFTNPDSSEEAFKLKSHEVVRLHTVKNASDIVVALEDVIKTAAKKPKDSWTLRTHGHWGFIFIDGALREIKEDDGVSPDRDIIRNMILANYDIDATGYHNAFVPLHFGIISAFEASVGMVKVASVELTLPVVAGLEIKNGPHHMVYFASAQIAEEIQKTILEPKSSRLPGEAPDKVVYNLTLEALRPYVERGEVAICVAHPAGALPGFLSAFGESKEEAMKKGKPYGGEISDCGLLNFALNGSILDLKTAIEMTRSLHMAVAGYNLSVPHGPILKAVPEREKELAEIAQMVVDNKDKFSGGRIFDMTQPAASMAFAFEMNRRYGLVSVVEDDKHEFHPLDYRQWPGALMRFRNDFTYLGVPTAKTVIDALRGEHPTKSVLFYEPKEMKVDGEKVISPAIIKERQVNGFAWKLQDLWYKIEGAFYNARDVLSTKLA